ncbi:hypothetical protein [Microbacterium paulum]
MQKQQFGELSKYFSVDVVDYADALGAAGIARFEAHLDKRRQALTTPFDGRPDAEFTHDDEWHTPATPVPLQPATPRRPAR